MSAPELKPCPFCGGDPYTRTTQDEDLSTHNIVDWHFVGCMNCDFSFGIPDGYDCGTASEQWNARADIPAARIAELEAENARLRDETTAAVAAEREACAHICDVETASRLEDARNAALKIRSLIRARADLDKGQ